jgi:hypothetical protein
MGGALRLRGIARVLLCLLVLCGFSPSSLLVASPAGPAGQLKPKDRYALIFGTVWGPDDRPVYGVTVKLRRARDKHARWETFSNHRGEFAQRVPAGKVEYVVWADLKGFKSAAGARFGPGEEVRVEIDNDERADIGLHLTKAVQ